MKIARSRSTLSCTSSYNSRPELRRRIKFGLRKSVPAAIVLWAFHKMPNKEGLTSRRLINYLKRHYKVDNPGKNGKPIATILRCAVEFGLLQKRGNRYFLAPKQKNQ
ncbi:unnamed protein product [Leptidea sinapis]|uniref:H15 domain-containing protein n=1 Tax=Leptidea sinapis TaxID=189913 RepID=A0A5E4Q532_9NEOP|nr:unnamed protein product [Leptidea sinapis]